MSVSDESGGKKDRKPTIFLKPAQWAAARHQYESENCSDARSVERIMAEYNVSERTVRNQIAKGGWKKGLQIGNGAEKKLHQVIDSKLEQVGEQIAQRIGSKVEADLAPWFEREKRLHVKSAMKRIKKRMKLIDGIVDDSDKISPKDAAYIAKSDDTYDAMARRNLGMNDSTGVDGALSVRVLTQGAAIEIQQG